ncbi:MAG: V-type ATP synthase subunit A, partial [Nitrosopumilaceae archaeon]|nr:V-type ATP synthase subunit A [Nitrosopumilaceae archaeon]
ALDAKLAYSRHYPSINWMNSYSGYLDDVAKWWHENVDEGWYDARRQVYKILQQDYNLQEIVKLLGPDSLPDSEKLVLDVARMIKIGLLQQNSFDDVDTYCSPEKQFRMLHAMLDFYKRGQDAIQAGVGLSDIRAIPVITDMVKAKMSITDAESSAKFDEIDASIEKQFGELKVVV